MILKQSTNRVRPILMVLASDGKTGATGKTLTITLKKDSSAYASISPTVTERGGSVYDVALTTAHTDTLSAHCMRATNIECDNTNTDDEVCPDLPGATVASVVGAVGSVTGAVGSVAGAVGSVTGDVGGNVQGT